MVVEIVCIAGKQGFCLQRSCGHFPSFLFGLPNFSIHPNVLVILLPGRLIVKLLSITSPQLLRHYRVLSYQECPEWLQQQINHSPVIIPFSHPPTLPSHTQTCPAPVFQCSACGATIPLDPFQIHRWPFPPSTCIACIFERQTFPHRSDASPLPEQE